MYTWFSIPDLMCAPITRHNHRRGKGIDKCTLYTIQCIGHTVQCTPYNVQCTLHDVAECSTRWTSHLRYPCNAKYTSVYRKQAL